MSPAKDTENKKLTIPRLFTQQNTDPYSSITWEKRTARIANDKGNVLFEQKDVEMPKEWSQMAIDVVVSKYFHGKANTTERETSLKQLINRVSEIIGAWGLEDEYFKTEQESNSFIDELKYILVNQYASFNSPVWFNCGVRKNPQVSACFINSIEDNMENILDLAKTEGLLFKGGSGTGSNMSKLRSSKEDVRGGGRASGPVSFMKGFDSFAGVIKSGGKLRRAAIIRILNVDHPDIEDFIDCKAKEEKKAWVLIDAGYDGSIGGDAYGSVFFQNSNNTVRVSNEFMKSVVKDKKFSTKAVIGGKIIGTYKAKDLLKKMAEAAHVCGDPGLQFDTTINEWHTCKTTSKINASNPCSEFMFVDDSACNLASLNLMKFVDDNDVFDVKKFCHVVNLILISQEILVDRGSYPTDKIRKNSIAYRPLGIGYANLGALLMAKGFPYDSDEGRAYAATLTALLTGSAYKMSAQLSVVKGSFEHFAQNKEAMLEVMQNHKLQVTKIEKQFVPEELYDAAHKLWSEVTLLGSEHGFRNAQVSVLAPTGTIGFMMDCDTTGIEPDMALVKYKKLAGGGMLKIVNQSVPRALQNLGHTPTEVEEILKYIEDHEKIEGAPHISAESISVFDCAFKPRTGSRYIHYMGHLRMMAAVQPFISGAISKTVNMPTECTVEEITNTFVEAWKLGLKSITIYRDGSKRTQPVTTSLEEKDGELIAKDGSVTPKPYRRRLANERPSITHKFSIAGHEGYLTVSMFEDGQPGEIFIRMAKEGSVVSGLVDAFATATSIMLQYGVPLKILINKFSHTRFEPSGFTQNSKIPIAKSILDYIFRWLSLKFVEGDPVGMPKEVKVDVDTEYEAVQKAIKDIKDKPKESKEKSKITHVQESDAPPCFNCGSMTVRSGSCYKCTNCGSTTGCS